MEVFVIPVGRDHHELYCENVADPDDGENGPKAGLFGQLRAQFRKVLQAAEPVVPGGLVSAPAPNWFGRAEAWILGWLVERIADQRLLWNLRRQTNARVMYPEDLSFDQATAIVSLRLTHEYGRHRVWLVIDAIGLVISSLFTLIPGPNLLAYYFAFRVVGHWLSMQGAVQGMKSIKWDGVPCAPLVEFKLLANLDPKDRQQKIQAIAARLKLPNLPSFFKRVSAPRA
jgi:hypothetical protein